MNIAPYKSKYGKAVSAKTILESNIQMAADNLFLLEARKEDLESAREIVNDVLCNTQNEVKGFIEEVVSLALSTVHGPEYSFEIDYTIKRNQSEANFYFVKNGEKYSPDFDSGGGVRDTAAFALRVVMYALMDPKPSPIFILDEPAKHLSYNLQELYGIMLNEISQLLGLQIITISQSVDCVREADRIYHVFMENEVSYVEEKHEQT